MNETEIAMNVLSLIGVSLSIMILYGVHLEYKNMRRALDEQQRIINSMNQLLKDLDKGFNGE